LTQSDGIWNKPRKRLDGGWFIDMDEEVDEEVGDVGWLDELENKSILAQRTNPTGKTSGPLFGPRTIYAQIRKIR
jgi:hypothetical protein